MCNLYLYIYIYIYIYIKLKFVYCLTKQINIYFFKNKRQLLVQAKFTFYKVETIICFSFALFLFIINRFENFNQFN